jgi:hypothetical protein
VCIAAAGAGDEIVARHLEMLPAKATVWNAVREAQV